MAERENIIQLSEKLLDRGEAEFALCPDCGDQCSFIPQVRKNSQGVFITLLICVGPHCDGEGIVFPVVNGYIGDAEYEAADD